MITVNVLNPLKLFPVAALVGSLFFTGCQQHQSSQTSALPGKKIASTEQADILITNGRVYLGDLTGEQSLDIAVCGELICGIYPTGSHQHSAEVVINAQGHIVSPGFIDPHTHTLDELLSQGKNANLNYLTQGVTTVVNGNDGGGPVDIALLAQKLAVNGIGTNVALFVGHNAIRETVMGRADRPATEHEIKRMQQLVDTAMQNGALGLSSGLYYVPGSYAETKEVVALAKTAAQYGGIYDTHLRDESTFNIGFLQALDEAIYVAKTAEIPLHLAHIKALGVDVWGQSEPAIAKIEQAQAQGVTITADQYPWLASGTKLHSAIMPKWVMADSKQAFYQRLNDPKLTDRLYKEIKENIRRRGGADSLLITAFSSQSIVGKTLEDIAKAKKQDPVFTAMELVQLGDIRIASFNMSEQDLERFMVKPWVVTSSDGTNGHPRKFASFSKKFNTYVNEKKLLTIDQFITQSSGKTANILGLANRGVIKKGNVADVIIWNAETFKPKADFAKWNQHSTGIKQALVNGKHVIKDSEYSGKLAGKYVEKAKVSKHKINF